jgi:hypothetical protein
MLAAPRDVGSVHLTLLRRDGSGKADVKPDKLIIGSPTIKIDDEERGRPIILAPLNDLLGLAITEGIEDGLTVHVATGLGAWAAGAAGFMPKLARTVPQYCDCVSIIADADAAGQRGSAQLAERLVARGIHAELVQLSGTTP